MNQGKTKNRNGWIAAGGLAFLCIVLLFLAARSDSGKHMGQGMQPQSVSKMSDALAVWESDRIKGRILVLFDRALNADPTGSREFHLSNLRVTDENYIYLAFRKNLVRKVYHVVPNAAWDEVNHALAGNPYVQQRPGGFRIVIEGMPVMIQRLHDLPSITEPVLVAINRNAVDPGTIEQAASLIRSGVLSCDRLTIAGPEAPAFLRFFN